MRYSYGRCRGLFFFEGGRNNPVATAVVLLIAVFNLSCAGVVIVPIVVVIAVVAIVIWIGHIR